LTFDEVEELLSEALGHLENGRFRMALTASRKAYEERPEDLLTIVSFAWATLENGKPHEALEIANQLVISHPSNSLPHYYRGYFLLRMGILEGAISDFNYVIKDQSDFQSRALLNKARALGGCGKFAEALAELELNQELLIQEDKLELVKDLLKKGSVFSEGGTINKWFFKKKELFEEAEDAFNNKEYWFSLWASKQVLKQSSFASERKKAHYVELESLISTFQYKTVSDRISNVFNLLKDEERFQILQKKLEKFKETDEKEKIDDVAGRSDLQNFKNELYTVLHARTFDYLKSLDGEKKYLLKFSSSETKYIGIEIHFENPFYRINDVEIEGRAEWYLDGNRIGVNKFLLSVEEKWKLVEFKQSWGSEEEGYWKKGQGRVDIYFDEQKICSRWFLIGAAETLNKEELGRFEVFSGEEEKEPLLSSSPADDLPLDELLDELNEFVGLHGVKDSMHDFVSYLKFLKEREKMGLKSENTLSLNCVFLGNPGTGKTTIARLLGKIFKAMGLLPLGHVIEVDRSALVGQFIGETAQKTEKIITEAQGGLLFIDEAYTLKKGEGNDFGQEAIDILLKRMEDNKGNFIVIVAGYPEEMQNFINSNPGLKSRFSYFFNFSDYNPDELTAIFSTLASREEYIVNEPAVKVVHEEFVKEYRKRDKAFSNARLARNLFNDIKIQLGKRIINLPQTERTKVTLNTIQKEDVEAVLKKTPASEVKILINEENLTAAMNKLSSLTGLTEVKNEIDKIVKLARLYHSSGEDLSEKLSTHYLFVGNPGTGKTTVARIFSEIYSALGILPRGHLVETDRQGLVGSYVGETALKTSALIDKAIGGTLFIDEAYTLIKKSDGGSDFGKEAVDTLLKRLEDDRGKFMVIAAGYPDEMKHFLSSNPGLSSRFNHFITFDDYSPEELLEIALKNASGSGFTFDPPAVNELKKYFNKIYRGRDKNFGNGRIVRDLLDSAVKNHLLRVTENKDASSIEKTLIVADVNPSILEKKEKSKVKIIGDAEALEEYMNELHELTGLESVKRSVEKLISSLKVSKLREERGLHVIPKNLHSVFLGNPGTGKTTVARLLSKIYKELGVLERGHLVEVDRSGLVAGYQGQTAVKTDAVIEKAMGGTLFIDEAYALYRGNNDFGQEAIDTLLKRMEDHQGKFIVIVAGYPEEMNEFVQSNPGLQSRFTNYFKFDDYSPRQMLEISYYISRKSGYIVDEGAWQQLLELFKELYEKRDKTFGNARSVKNLFYKAVSNQEERILTLSDPTDEELSTITLEDISHLTL
jgi:SpoVK/Ycf46/Vps4 family AAA+-type ATPase/tetratricopeptide (TPR) repeat protein